MLVVEGDTVPAWLLPTSTGASSKYRDLEQQLSRPQSPVKCKNSFVCETVAAIKPVTMPERCMTKLDPGNSSNISTRMANGAYLVFNGNTPHISVVDSPEEWLLLLAVRHLPPPHASNVIKENRTPLKPTTHVAGTHDVTTASTRRNRMLLMAAKAMTRPMRLDDPTPSSIGVAIETHVNMLKTQCNIPACTTGLRQNAHKISK